MWVTSMIPELILQLIISCLKEEVTFEFFKVTTKKNINAFITILIIGIAEKFIF